MVVVLFARGGYLCFCCCIRFLGLVLNRLLLLSGFKWFLNDGWMVLAGLLCSVILIC